MIEKKAQILQQIADIIDQQDNFLVTCHVRPDGDAIGALFGMAHLLRALGKKFQLYNPDPLPTRLSFLPTPQPMIRTLDDRKFAWLILLDCPDPSRVTPLLQNNKHYQKSIVLDHHLASGTFGDFIYSTTEAAATGEIVYDLSQLFPWKITPEFATCIYTAIMADTGGFRFSNTTPKVLDIAAKVVQHGAKPADISEHLFEQEAEVRIRLLADVLQTLELQADGQIGCINVTKAVLQKYQVASEWVDGFIDYPRSIAGVKVAIQIREDKNDYYRISLRSKDNLDVEQVARFFGGGGHRQAAGCGISGTLESVRQQLFAQLKLILTTT